MEKVLLEYAGFIETLHFVFDRAGGHINGISRRNVIEAIERHGEFRIAESFTNLVNDHTDLRVKDVRLHRDMGVPSFMPKEEAFFLVTGQYTIEDIDQSEVIMEGPLHVLPHRLAAERILDPSNYDRLRGLSYRAKVSVLHDLLNRIGLLLIHTSKGHSPDDPEARYIVAHKRILPRYGHEHYYRPTKKKKSECKSIW